MHDDWQAVETTTHQEHVIAHVLGASALGYFVADEAAHFVLDIGFVWSVLLDGAMGLVPYSMALAELNVDEEARAALRADVARLYEGGGEDLTRITPAPDGCLITAVEFYARDERRRLVLECEGATVSVETSLETSEIEINVSEARA